MSPKGTHNHIIKAAIAAGMRLENGSLVLPSGAIYRGSELGEGYHRVTLRHNGKKIEVTRARIVCWLAHGEPPTPQHQADHINRVRNDDRPENLRWATPLENVQNVSDAVRSERSTKMQARHDEVKRLRASHAALVAALEASRQFIREIQSNHEDAWHRTEKTNADETLAAIRRALNAAQGGAS